MSDTSHLFYEIMNYPLPRQREFFAYWVGKEPRWVGYVDGKTWNETSELQNEYCTFVKKRLRVWKYIPFIEAVYLGNSLTFNALHEWSDIDLLVVTNVKRLRRWRLMSVLFLRLLRIKRTQKNSVKKFCLSFTVSRDACNLQTLKLSPYDPYLIYWIAHLVPVYFEFEEYELNMYKENNWINLYLPNHPLQQIVDLDIPIMRWLARPRKIIEKLFWWVFWDMIEWLIKIVRLPFVLRKRKKLWTVWEDCIISDSMLKFHFDKRKLYALKWKLAQK